MTYVWVLVIYMTGGSHGGGPAIIDNIASRDECVRAQELLVAQSQVGAWIGARCIQVGKVRP